MDSGTQCLCCATAAGRLLLITTLLHLVILFGNLRMVHGTHGRMVFRRFLSLRMIACRVDPVLLPIWLRIVEALVNGHHPKVFLQLRQPVLCEGDRRIAVFVLLCNFKSVKIRRCTTYSEFFFFFYQGNVPVLVIQIL